VIASIFEWIVVGAAHRIVAGDVTPDEALQLLVTERGRHARHSAQVIVREWWQPTIVTAFDDR
jgi:hypothetical protein